MFWNLLANAVKFTPAGGSVGVGVHADESSVVVSVTDTGLGFAADFLPRRRFGAAATGAGNAAEAMSALHAAMPALVLCDIGMPGADGYGLLERMREVSSALPVIALTSFARPEDRQKAMASGFVAHIAKLAEPATALKICAAEITRARDMPA